jgi:hypothetical protein
MDLDQPTIDSIESRLPDLSNLGQRALSLTPDFISMAFEPDSSVPLAAPCLGDAYRVASECRFALFEGNTCLVWFRKGSPTPDEEAAIWHGRFYTTAAASCLYAAAEDVASAIVEMMQINRSKLKPSSTRGVSLQVRVAKYLTRDLPKDTITARVQKLGKSRPWQNAMLWRDRWVHEQSLVTGLGISYDRKKRWQRLGSPSATRQVLWIGTGDRPRYSIDEVLGFVTAAFLEFVSLLDSVVTRYEAMLTSAGIKLDTSE